MEIVKKLLHLLYVVCIATLAAVIAAILTARFVYHRPSQEILLFVWNSFTGLLGRIF